MVEDDLDRRAGWTNSSAAETLVWIGEYLASEKLEDVRRKLHRSGCAERHAFIIVPGFTTAPFGATNLLLGYAGQPETDPVLPVEITHLWMVSTWAIGTGWRWNAVAGWQTFDKLQADEESSA